MSGLYIPFIMEILFTLVMLVGDTSRPNIFYFEEVG